MRRRIPSLLPLLLALPAGFVHARPLESLPLRPAQGADDAAVAFLASLAAEQRAAASFTFDDPERRNWHFVPKTRPGVYLGDLDDAQRARLQELLRASMSSTGYFTAEAIRNLDDVLREIAREKGGNWRIRSADLYAVTVFGEPGSGEPWGWRFEGHHLSLNFTSLSPAELVLSPMFLGTNPRVVQQGKWAGQEVLEEQRRLAFELLGSLDAEQRKAAVTEPEGRREIESAPGTELPGPPAGSTRGLRGARLRPEQRDLLVRLIGSYLLAARSDLGAQARLDAAAAQVDATVFSWSGGDRAQATHGYRVHGPTAWVEYTTTQPDAGHVHTVYRDLERDFGGPAAER